MPPEPIRRNHPRGHLPEKTMRPWKKLPPLLVVAAAGFAANGLLLFTDHSVWDGLLYLQSYGLPGGREAMWQLFNEAGRPLDYFSYLLAFETGHPVFVSKAVGVLSWTACGILCQRVLRKAGGLGTAESTLIAALAVSLPVFDVLGDFSMWMHTTSLLFFWIAAALLTDLPERRGPLHALLRASALLLFFVSFNLNSLLVFFYALAVALVLVRLERRAWHKALWLPLRFPDFTVLPVFFWFLKNVATPTSGYYAKYNKPVFSWDALGTALPGIWRDFLLPESISFFNPAVLPVAALVCASGLSFVLAHWKPCGESPGGGLRLVLAGGVLLAGALLPYALVGQWVFSHGWWSRNAMLTSLPLALLVAGVSILAVGLLPIHFHRLWMVPMLAMVFLGISASNRAILRLQGFGAKQEAVRNALQNEIQNTGAAVVQLRDYFEVPRTIDFYPPIIWTFLVADGKGAPHTLVFDTIPLARHSEVMDVNGNLSIQMPVLPVDQAAIEELVEASTMPYILESIPRRGPQFLAVVQKGPLAADGLRTGLEYLRIKWTSPSELPDYLKGVANISTMPLSPIP
jgi:hypothetical protein